MVKDKRKLIGLIFIVIGLVFLMAAGNYWFGRLNAPGAPDTWEKVRGWINTTAGVVSCTIGVLNYLKKQKKAPAGEAEADKKEEAGGG